MTNMANEWLKSAQSDSRYPGEMGLLPYGKPTLKDAKEFFDFANMIYDKIINILKEED